MEPGRLYSQKTGQAKSVITLLNYSKYNPLKEKNGTAENLNIGTAEDLKSGTENGTLYNESDKQGTRDLLKKKKKTIGREGDSFQKQLDEIFK